MNTRSILTIFRFCLATLFLITLKISVKAQINTESIDSYIRLTEAIQADKKMTEADWETFFNLEGNSAALRAVKDKERFKKAFIGSVEHTYGSNNFSQNELLPKGILKEIEYFKQNSKAIKSYIDNLEKSAIIDSMYSLTYQYLPSRYRKSNPLLKVYYTAPLIPNAFHSNQVIYINAVLDYQLSFTKFGCLGAHELHHSLIRNLVPRQPLSRSELWVYFIARSLSSEGSADLVDKKYFLSNKSDLQHTLVKSLTRSDSLISNLNQEFERILTTKGETVPPRGNGIEELGHTPGLFMALTIERNGYLDQLIENIDNPFQFLIIYSQAAKKDPNKPSSFSDKTIRLIKELEKKFLSQM